MIYPVGSCLKIRSHGGDVVVSYRNGLHGVVAQRGDIVVVLSEFDTAASRNASADLHSFIGMFNSQLLEILLYDYEFTVVST